MIIIFITTRDEQHLKIFERKILRKLFGPVQGKDGSWRIRMNHELNELIGNADIVRYEGWNFNSGNYLFTTDTK